MLTPVLDLRSGFRNSPEGMRLTNATATGGVGGFTIESQRRSVGGVQGLSMRITAPDGGVLNIASHRGISASNAQAPVSGALSLTVGYAFRTRRTPKQERECLTAMRNVFNEGQVCLRERVVGDEARLRVQCAAEGADVEAVKAWLDNPAYLANDPNRNRLGVRNIARLLAHGFTPETVVAYLGPFGDAGSIDRVKAGAVFRRHEWTTEQMDELALVVTGMDPDATNPGASALVEIAGWARLGPEVALLAARAGITERYAKYLRHTGKWDEMALRTLAALRN